MPKRDRGAGFTALTFAFTIAVFVFFVLFVYDLGRKNGEAIGKNIANTNTYSSHAEEDIKQCASLPDEVAVSECIRRVIEASNEHQRAEDDLVAQTEMGLWALGMLLVTSVTTIITGLGVYFVWQTLRQTAETNRSAVAAASAAIDSNRIAASGQRPWLKIQITGCGPIVGSDDGRISLKIDISVTNLGKTPAAGVWHGAGLNLRHLGPGPHGDVFVEAFRQSASLASSLKIGSVLFPGEGYNTSVFGNFMEPTGRNNDVARTITFAVTATYDGGIEPGGHTVTGFAQVEGFKMIDGPSISDLLGNSLPVKISPFRSIPF